MLNLADIWTPGDGVDWLVGIVKTVNASGTIDVIVSGSNEFTRDVAVLSSYIPVAGQTVHILAKEGVGAVALGEGKLGSTLPANLIEQPVVTVNATDVQTYSAGVWFSGMMMTGENSTAVWFYNVADFVALKETEIEMFEIEVSVTSGGPPRFITHQSTDDLTPLVVNAGPGYWPPNPPAEGTIAWVPLPLDWGLSLISGTIKGIGIAGELYEGLYAGTGTLRFRALSVAP